MDGDEFEDLLREAEMLRDMSPISLTGTAANMSFAESADGNFMSQYSSTSRVRVPSPYLPEHRQDDSSLRGEVSTDVSSPALNGSWETSENGNRTLPQPHIQEHNSAVIEHIEGVYEELVDALLNEKPEIGITLKIRNSHSRLETRQRAASIAPTRRICFPGRTADEAWRFAVVVRIMELVHEVLRNNTAISKRDIFYRDPALFGQQKHVDRYVDDIAFTFGVTRSALNVTAAAKGLVAGGITFCHRDGALVGATTSPEGILVPNLKEVMSVDMTTVKWILIVEKDAIFRSITASSFWRIASAEGVLLTGKGYPDLASRALLRFLSTAAAQNGFASPPVFGFADFDPDGIKILDTYKHGSKTLDHETELHKVPQLQWLGLRSEHLKIAISNARAAQGLLSLSFRDRNKAVKMLEESCASENEDHSLMQHELQRMLMLNVKAEVELLDAIPNGLAELLHAHFDKL